MRCSRYFGCFFSSNKPKISQVVPVLAEQTEEVVSYSGRQDSDTLARDENLSSSFFLISEHDTIPPDGESLNFNSSHLLSETPVYEGRVTWNEDMVCSLSSEEEEQTQPGEIFIGTPRLDVNDKYVEYSPRGRVRYLMYGGSAYAEDGSKYVSAMNGLRR